MTNENPTLPFGPRILTVTEVVDGLKKLIESEYRDILIRGEISNMRPSAAGHLYFTLKDKQAQLSAVCFRRQASYLKFKPEDGMIVTARGSASLYPPRGSLQIIVESMEPEGLGALQLAFEQLKERLRLEGLFDESRKKRIPMLPSKIGIVTSPTGAAVQDILRILKKRNNRIDVLIYPARVQGEKAADEIVRGIRYLDSRDDVDVMIIGRGGGSLEDLWPFNEERVARAIAEAGTPIISAVGHEIDFTIADFAADLRAPTPSAAAETVSAGRLELKNRLESLEQRLIHSIRFRLESRKRQLAMLIRSPGFTSLDSRIRVLIQRLDELSSGLVKNMRLIFERIRTRLEQNHGRLERQMEHYLSNRRQKQEALSAQLKAFSPQRVLERGYAIVRCEAGDIVRNPAQLDSGDRMDVRVALGSFRAVKE